EEPPPADDATPQAKSGPEPGPIPDPVNAHGHDDDAEFEIGAADHGHDGAVPFEVRAYQQKKVLCVEAQDQIRDAFRKTLSRMGYRALIVGDAELAAERFRESPVDVVIFDIDGLGPTA